MLTQKEMIMDACNKNNISLKDLCSELKLNYLSMTSNVGRRKLNAITMARIAQYLNIDIFDLIYAPIKGNDNE